MANVLITGSNRGIGYELCRQFKERGDNVLAACRTSSHALEKLGVQVQPGVDITAQSSVDSLAERLRGTSIDILINNAGVLSRESIDDMSFDRIRAQFEINALGPMRITMAMLNNLHAGSKIAIISSRMGSIGDNSSGGRYGYRMSKAAVNMAGVSLARDLKPRGIAVAVLHPGFVRTEVTGNEGMIDPPEAARGLIDRIDKLSLETSGSFWHANGEPLPW